MKQLSGFGAAIKRSQNRDCTNQLMQFRKIVYMLLDEPNSSNFARCLHAFMVILILISQMQLILDSVYDEQEPYNTNSIYLELVLCALFALEYIFRFLTFTLYNDNLFKQIISPMNMIDLISTIPFGYLTGHSPNIIQSYRMLKILRTLRTVKLCRYLSGIKLLKKSVSQSAKEFFFVILGFGIVNLAYSTCLYYSENAENYELSFGNSIWLGTVTITTTGYGDYVPKSVTGMIITCLVVMIANTVLFALPVAILEQDFHKQYMEEKESTQIKNLKLQSPVGHRRSSIKNKEFTFMNHRLQLIQQRNKEIQELLDKSNEMAKQLTKDLKKLFLSVNGEEEIEEDITPQNAKGNLNVLAVKANIYEKLLRARRKIQVTNIFRNLNESNDENSHSSRIKVQSQRKINIQQPIKRRRILIKSHSQENENQLLILRNEQYGYIPYEFMNEILVEFNDDIQNGDLNNQIELMKQEYDNRSKKGQSYNQPLFQKLKTKNPESTFNLNVEPIINVYNNNRSTTENSRQHIQLLDGLVKVKGPQKPPEFEAGINNLIKYSEKTNRSIINDVQQYSPDKIGFLQVDQSFSR